MNTAAEAQEQLPELLLTQPRWNPDDLFCLDPATAPFRNPVREK
jgi:hypothetical protein